MEVLIDHGTSLWLSPWFITTSSLFMKFHIYANLCFTHSFQWSIIVFPAQAWSTNNIRWCCTVRETEYIWSVYESATYNIIGDCCYNLIERAPKSFSSIHCPSVWSVVFLFQLSIAVETRAPFVWWPCQKRHGSISDLTSHSDLQGI